MNHSIYVHYSALQCLRIDRIGNQIHHSSNLSRHDLLKIEIMQFLHMLHELLGNDLDMAQRALNLVLSLSTGAKVDLHGAEDHRFTTVVVRLEVLVEIAESIRLLLLIERCGRIHLARQANQACILDPSLRQTINKTPTKF